MMSGIFNKNKTTPILGFKMPLYFLYIWKPEISSYGRIFIFQKNEIITKSQIFGLSRVTSSLLLKNRP